MKRLALLLLPIWGGGALVMLWLSATDPGLAGVVVYPDAGVHPDDTLRLCFVGNAVFSRPNRVREVAAHIQEFEQVANINFVTLDGLPVAVAAAPGGPIAELQCTPPTPLPSGDYFDGDIRVVLPGIPGTKVDWWPGEEGTGPVPGNGCPMFLDDEGNYCDASCNPNSNNDGWGSWANSPNELSANRSCMYNLKLGDDGENGLPYLNHTLHEFGHALGLAHEHERTDANAGCTEDGYGTGLSGGFLTPYDRDSVMHYKFNSCGINGNYDYTGLSAWDRLALHILYPEDNQVAEFVGTTVIREGQLLSLQSAWLARGANLNFAAGNFVWHINGNPYPGPTLEIDLGVGEYTLEFSYQDFLGRDYYYSGPVRVLSEDDFNTQVVAPIMTNLPLVYPNFFYEYTADLSLQLDENVSIFFPAGLFASDVVIDYARQPSPEVSMQSIDVFYDLVASDVASGELATIVPGQMYSVTIHYEDTAVPVPFNESDLALYYWHDGNWVLEASSQLDAAANRITATPNHFSRWAVLARNPIYLPYIQR